MLVELAHRYDLPIFGLTGCSDSKLPDEQAAAEAAFSHHARDAGRRPDGARCRLPGRRHVQLDRADRDLRRADRLHQALHAPAEINDETLALDLIDEIGPDGDFLSSEHTLKHYREDWYPKLFDRRNFEDWNSAGTKTLRTRARASPQAARHA